MAKPFCYLPSMLDSLEVQSSIQPDGGEGGTPSVQLQRR